MLERLSSFVEASCLRRKTMVTWQRIELDTMSNPCRAQMLSNCLLSACVHTTSVQVVAIREGMSIGAEFQKLRRRRS